MRHIVIMAALLVGACAPASIVSTPPAACADLVPAEWSLGVDAAPIPQNATVSPGALLTPAMVATIIAPWAAAYSAMSAALETANGRTADAVGIVRQCERRMNAARP